MGREQHLGEAGSGGARWRILLGLAPLAVFGLGLALLPVAVDAGVISPGTAQVLLLPVLLLMGGAGMGAAWLLAAVARRAQRHGVVQDRSVG